VIISLAIPISEEHFFLGFPGQNLIVQQGAHKNEATSSLLGIPISEKHSFLGSPGQKLDLCINVHASFTAAAAVLVFCMHELPTLSQPNKTLSQPNKTYSREL